jgi:predicted DNA binding CopG/RHH family protein
MAQSAINIKNIKRDFESEMQRRNKERQMKQDIEDVTELNRRLQTVKDGTDRFYSEAEAEAILNGLGYYD